MADALLRRFESSSLKSTVRIADLGCGTGYLLGQLIERGFDDLHGFDIAREMLTMAGSTTQIESDRLIEADLQALPVPDDQFDIVFSNASIQWCNTASAANEIRRVLCPGGRGFISTFGPQTLQQWRSVFESHGHTSVHQFDSCSQLTKTFEAADLSLNQIDAKLVSQTFDNVKDMFDSIRKLGASNAAASRKPISKSVFQSIQNEFAQRLAKDGFLTLTYEAFSFEVS